MRGITKKLQSTSGVTILFALLAFMVAAMVSAVLVNAALTNVKRVVNTKEQNQQYLAVESTVKLLKDSISKCSISFECEETTTTTRIVDYGGEAGTTEVEWDGPSNIDVYAESVNAAISNIITTNAVNCLQSDSYSNPTELETHTISILCDDGTQICSVSFQVETKYEADYLNSADDDSKFDIVIYINLDSTSDYKNAMTMKITGKCEEISWDSEEGDFVTDDGKTETRTDKITHHYEISWGNILVTKSVPSGT